MPRRPAGRRRTVTCAYVSIAMPIAASDRRFAA
jgi:hypothetical protein